METSATILVGSALRRHAILCVLGASACYSITGALVKAVSAEFPTAEIVLFRSATAVLVTLPLLRRHGGITALRTRRPWNHGADALPLLPVAAVLLGVIAWALSMISIRQMGGAGESNVAIVLWFSFGAILYTTVLGMAIWSEIPDLWNIAGIAIIIGSGLYIWQYEAGPGRK